MSLVTTVGYSQHWKASVELWTLLKKELIMIDSINLGGTSCWHTKLIVLRLSKLKDELVGELFSSALAAAHLNGE